MPTYHVTIYSADGETSLRHGEFETLSLARAFINSFSGDILWELSGDKTMMQGTGRAA